MKQLFTILNAIFANQDQDTLRTMVGDALGVDSANFEYCNLEIQPTNGGGIRVTTQILEDETDHIKTQNKFILVPIDGEILYRLGLALENGNDEETQRDQFGDKTIDWFNTISEQNNDLQQEFYETL